MASFEDYFVPGASGALSGAATGAAVGSVIPGLGTGIGAAVGGGIGLLGGLFGGGANAKKKAAMEAARREAQQRARESYMRRQQDLQTAMGYFAPVNAKLADLYGEGAVVPQQQQWQPRPWDAAVTPTGPTAATRKPR